MIWWVSIHILTLCRIITVTPFRAILGITLIVASIGYLSYREIKLGNLLGPEYDIIKDAVRFYNWICFIHLVPSS